MTYEEFNSFTNSLDEPFDEDVVITGKSPSNKFVYAPKGVICLINSMSVVRLGGSGENLIIKNDGSAELCIDDSFSVIENMILQDIGCINNLTSDAILFKKISVFIKDPYILKCSHFRQLRYRRSIGDRTYNQYHFSDIQLGPNQIIYFKNLIKC